jgi:hypothetical protein
MSGAGLSFLSTLMLILAQNHAMRLVSGVAVGLGMIATAFLWPGVRAPATDRSPSRTSGG